jgi:hypothetical protein
MAAGHFCHVDSRDLYNFVGTDSAVYKSLKHQDRCKKTEVCTHVFGRNMPSNSAQFLTALGKPAQSALLFGSESCLEESRKIQVEDATVQ